jgi:hypothetical protein
MRSPIIALAIFVGFSGVLAFADEEKIALDKLPKPVLETVKKRFPKGELLGASKEVENGKTLFEVELKDGGKKIDVMVTLEGVITVIEKQIAATDVPKAVKESIDKAYPKATWKVIEEVIAVKEGKETLDYYEVLLETADKKKVEVKIAVDGKIKGKEEKKGEDK